MALESSIQSAQPRGKMGPLVEKQGSATEKDPAVPELEGSPCHQPAHQGHNSSSGHKGLGPVPADPTAPVGPSDTPVPRHSSHFSQGFAVHGQDLWPIPILQVQNGYFSV